MATIPLHAVPDIGSATLLILVTIAAMGTALLLGVAFAALVRRRSRPYLLLVAAFTALFARSVVAGFSMFGMLSPTTHHFFEHGMDVLLIALVVAAVYYARTVSHEGSAV
ncbi:hypothetical protein DP107_19515 [Haloglomus irregulare]|jgi:hypothetical protein|uniref:Uncharacterized protein n=1 Tax=Haloglomus irregulare TaxID=2234134 RepID=A0A554MTR8_9EURY|nr:hypothetical protein [Haloglomus irregulare]TSD08529.1 hypothetical protein DP107_19515 [Haloglomus irregulare]